MGVSVIFKLSDKELAGVLSHFSKCEGIEESMTIRQAYNQLWKLFGKRKAK